MRRPDRVLNIAHRGASAAAPENTLAALRQAIALGADAVEIDVQRTRDGVLVVLHDECLTRTTDVRRCFPDRAPWRLRDLTAAEVCRLDAGAWKSPRYAGARVPALLEVLELTERSGIRLQLEVKKPHLYPGIVSELAEVLGQRPGGDVVVQSFDFAAMKELKVRLPALRVGLLGTPDRSHLPALGSWADQVNPRHRTIDRAYVDAVHATGMQCCAWTVDGPAAMRRALRHGVDGIITNRPDRLASLNAGVAGQRSARVRDLAPDRA